MNVKKIPLPISAHWLLNAVILLSGLLWTCGDVEASERYVLHSRSVRVPPTKSAEWDVWLHDNTLQRNLWKRRLVSFDADERVHWSKDRRALAIECQTPNQKPGVMVWREGFRLRYFGVPGRHEYPMGCVWSPDNRRLLVRAGGSGAFDIGYGELFCLSLGHWPRYKYFRIGWAREMDWQNNKTVIFRGLQEVGDKNNPGYGEIKKPEFWHVP